MTSGRLSRHARLVVAAVLATPVVLTLGSSPGQAALGGVTPFEIDSNTTVQAVGATDWLSKFAAGDVAVANDTNFTGAAVVQSDVGSSTTAPGWLANCVHSNADSVFKNSTSIADPNWVGDDETQSVPDKQNICQSYFSYDVVQSGPRAGHIVSYLAFTRRVFNGDGSYYFLLSKGPNPDIRVAGDIVIEVDYDSQGAAQALAIATWGGAGPTLGAATSIAVNDSNVQLSPVQYFAEMAIDLTALGLAPDVYELPSPESCLAFGYGRVISRTGNSASATLKDDGEPTALDFNVCGSLVIKKQLTASVPGTTGFPVTVTPPDGVTLAYANPVLEVPGGTTSGGTPVDGNADPAPLATPTGNPVNYTVLPPRQSGGYNVWENLTGELAQRWDLVDIVCVNDKGTPTTTDDVTTVIDSPNDEFNLLTLETVTCTITNAPAPATINVDKLAGGNAGTWPVDLTGTSSGSVNVTDDGTNDFTTGGTFQSFGQRSAGSYTLTEGAEAGGGAFRPSGWSCTVVGGATSIAAGASIGINANPGDVINCTITNTPVPPPSLDVVKTASPTSFAETATAPGSPIEYTVEVRNTGIEPFTITDLSDFVEVGAVDGTFDLDAAVAGNGAGIPGSSIVANDCGSLIGQVVAGGASRTCQFSVAYSGRNAGDAIHDVATASVVDEFNRPASDSDDASVTVTDVLPVLTVDKQNVPVDGTTAIVEPGGLAVYSITITNGPNAIESITITGVTDTVSSDGGGFPPTGIDYFTVAGPVTATTCSNFVGTVLAVGASVTCQITIDTTQLGVLIQDDVLTNHVAVTAVDDDGTPVAGDDDASRTVLGAPPVLDVFKTDGGAQIPEPGADVDYAVTLTNLSPTEPLTIVSIVDEVFFTPGGGARESRGVLVIDAGGVDPSGLVGVIYVATDCDTLIGTTLAPNGGAAACTITLDLGGNAGDLYDDLVTVSAVDDEGEPAEAENEAETPVVDTPPVIAIDKAAQPTQVPESGGEVVYTLTITNNSGPTDPMTLTSLSDSVFGSFFPTNTLTGVSATTCLELQNTVLQPGQSVNCTMTATISGAADDAHDNVASVTGVDDEGTSDSDADDASVLFTDVLPVIEVTKSADRSSVDENGEPVTFTVTVENRTFEAVTITSLVDSVFGDLVGLQGSTCVAGVPLGADDGVDGSGPDFYECQFVQTVSQIGNAQSHHDIVTVAAEDDDDNTATDDDDETITFDLIPPTVEIVKTDDDATVDEPGGTVTYTLDITNTTFEDVTVTALTDTITYENPAGQTVVDLLAPVAPVSNVECHDANGGAITITSYAIAPDETVTCTFDVSLSGTAQIVRDVANVVVVDNDGQSGGDDDDEATPILDTPPAVEIVKSANPTQIDSGGTVTYSFVITNLSAHEQLTLLSLVDDKFGDIFAECVADGMDTTLDVGQSTSCEITRVLQQLPGSTHVNVVTVTGGDDEVLAGVADPVSDNDDASVFTNTAIRIDALAPDCVANAPYIQYDITPLGFTPSGNAKLTFYDLDGNLVESVTVSQLTGRVLYPGADVDAQGNAIDWPGWKFENGLWVIDPSDARLRDGLKVVVEVNPTAEATVSYVPATSPCADPQQVAADLAIVKSASQPQVGAGGGFSWDLAVVNNGPDAATDVVVNDIVPSQFIVTGVTSSQFTCSHSGNTVSCTKPSMAVGETGQIAIAVTVPASAASGSVTNVGTVTATTPDPDPTNNSDDASVTLVAQQQPVPPPAPPPVALPPTGASSTRPVAIAALGMVLFGGVATLVGRRRRSSTPVG